MVNVKVFCPFERLASIFVKIAYENSVNTVSIKWDRYGSSSVPVRKRYQDFALRFTPAQRLEALRADSITGEVYFDDSRYRFECRNDLLVEAYQAPSAAINGESKTNGLLSTGEKVCYPEAFRTTALKMSSLDSVSEEEPVSSARVFYQYMLEDIDRESKFIKIRGPSNFFSKFRPDFALRTEFGDAVVLTDSPRSNPDEDFTIVESASLARKGPIEVMLEYDTDKLLPFVIRQDMYTIRGTPLSCETVLQILKIVAYIELADKFGYATEGVFKLLRFDGQTVTIPLVQVSGHYVMEANYWQENMGYVCDCQPVQTIFARYLASPDDLMMRLKDDSIVRITSNVAKTSTCFAYVFTSALIIDKELPSVAFFELLNALVDDGQYIVHESGTLVGYTHHGDLAAGMEQFHLKSCGLILDSLKRETVNEVDLQEGIVYIVGGDFGSSNRVPNACDHYILATYSKGGLDVVYDPLASSGRGFGTRIDSIEDLGSMKERHFGRVTAEVRYV